MAYQLLPPPELTPTVRDGLPPEQYVAMWADLLDTCEQFLVARLRQEVGPNGDVRAAYQAWYNDRMEEHDRTMQHMLEELGRRERACQPKP